MEEDRLRERLRRLPKERLADELISLGYRDASIGERVDRLSLEQDPAALAATLRRNIDALGRTTDYIPYARSFAFGHDLQHIVDTIRERLLPYDPDLAFELADLFLQSDVRVFECADDSGGAIGDVFRDACKLWLETAARSSVKRDWVALFKERAAEDDYGSRDELLPNAAILFPETTLREMASEYLVEAQRPRSESDRLDYSAFSASSNARQLAIALRDPRRFEEATRAGGGLNTIQRIEVVKKYLECGDPESALSHLAEIPDHPGSERLDLLSECYGRLGRTPEQIAVLMTIFEQTLCKKTYEQVLKLKPEAERGATREWGRTTALGFKYLDTAAVFLFESGWPDDAERLVLEHSEQLATKVYTQLLRLAELAEKAGKPLVKVICYRHLIRDILGEARSRAYAHAAHYLEQLGTLDATGIEYGKLGDHPDFVAELRKVHGRKSAFWGKVEGGRR